MATVTAMFIGLALLLLALLGATAGSRNSDQRSVRANGGPVSVFVASLAYLIVLAPVVMPYGLVVATSLLLIVVVALPAIGAGLAVKIRGGLGTRARAAYDWVGVVVAFGLLAGLLATAGSVLSLMGGVNRILVTWVLAIAAAAYLLAVGRESAARTSRWAFGFVWVIPVLLLVVGVVVSKPAVLADSLVPYTPLPLGTAAAMLLAVAACAVLDPSIGAVLHGSAKPGKAALWAGVLGGLFVLVFGVALILVFGGAFVAPTLQAFLLGAAPAAVIGFFLFFAVIVVTSAADTQLASAAELVAENTTPCRRPRFVALIAFVAAVLATVLPVPGQIFAIVALVAAAGLGAVIPSAVGSRPDVNAAIGVVVAVVVSCALAVALGFEDALAFTGTTAICIAVSFVVALATSAVLARKPAAAPAAA